MRTPFWLTLLLGFLTAVGPVSTDMYLPAFPQIDAALGRIGAGQITLAAWFAGLAVGQITQGTLSDRLGRRVPLILGTAVFAAASAGCALAQDLGTFSVCRVVAAIGGSAGMVVPRAVVRDLADGHEAARLLSRLMLIMGVVPILAPALGGAVLAIAPWQVIFWAAAAYGVLCTALVWLFLPDTLPADRRIRLGPAGILARYTQIARERSFLTHASIGGAGLGALFAYLAGSPAVFIQEYHLSPSHYGMVFGLNAAGYIAAAQANARLLPWLGMNGMLRLTTRAFLGFTLLLGIAAYTGAGGLAGIMVPLFLAQSTLGFMLPTATVGALSRHAAHAASASALMGTGQFVLGALAGTLVGVLANGTARPMAVLMLAGALGTVLADLARPRVEPPALPAE